MAIPAVFRAPSMQAICMPRQMPKNGMLRSRAKRTLAILPSEPRSPNPPGTRIAVHRLELSGDLRIVLLEHLGVDPADVDPHAVGHAAVDQRLVQRLVGIGQADVLADHRDRHLAFGVLVAVHDVRPARQVGRRAVQAEMHKHLLVEPLGMVLQRHRIDAGGVERLDDRFGPDVAEQRDLGALARAAADVRSGTAGGRAGRRGWSARAPSAASAWSSARRRPRCRAPA